MPPLMPDKIVQKIRDMDFQLDLDVIPKEVKSFWTDNILIQTITRLVGKGRLKYIPIKATEAGSLKVAVTGGGTDVYDTRAKAVIADAFVTKDFADICSRVDVTTWGFNVVLQLSNDGTTFLADIVVNKDTFYSIDQSIKSIKYKNGTPGSNATLQLVGFY